MPRDDSFHSALSYEIAREKAATLKRVTSRLEEALALLQSLDRELARGAAATPELRARREQVLQEAAEWTWYIVIQREAMGLTQHDSAFEDLGVPEEVRRRMGPRKG